MQINTTFSHAIVDSEEITCKEKITQFAQLYMYINKQMHKRLQSNTRANKSKNLLGNTFTHTCQFTDANIYSNIAKLPRIDFTANLVLIKFLRWEVIIIYMYQSVVRIWFVIFIMFQPLYGYGYIYIYI